MLKILPLTIALFIGAICYSQESQYNYKYEFKIAEISESGTAKMKTDEIRDLMGVKIVRFNSVTQKFTVFSNFEFDVEELLIKFELNDIHVDGGITKFEIE